MINYLAKRRFQKPLLGVVVVCYVIVMITNNFIHEGHLQTHRIGNVQKETLTQFGELYNNSRTLAEKYIHEQNVITQQNKMSERELIIKKRYQTQKNACAVLANYTINSPEVNFRAHMQVVPEHKMVYCGIEKVGSTFWRRLIQLLRHRKTDSPYSIQPQHTMRDYKSFLTQKITNYTHLLHSNAKFIFVRDPYTRLLSGYVDKIYSPNPYYWGMIGKKAVKFNRQLNIHCGHDVTFPEFVKYFIHTEENNVDRDGHFLPSNDHCRPCGVNYDYIGKMESFSEDVLFILEKFKLHNYSKTLSDFKNQSIVDSIYDAAQAEVSMRNFYKKCLSIHNGMRRIWRKMQIRGFIADEIKYPFREQDSPLVNVQKFRNEMIKANIVSRKTKDLTAQKRKHLINAFNLLSLETMNKLQKIFKNDFLIFGYEQRPKYLFLHRKDPVKDIFKI